MSLGFRLYSYFNGNLVHQDSLGNKYYHDKKNSSKRWVVYAQSRSSAASDVYKRQLPTQFHNWLHNTSDEISNLDLDTNNQESLVKRRIQKHSVKHKETIDKGYNSWNPK